MLHKVWIIREVVVLAVFEDEDAIVFQQSPLKDEAEMRLGIVGSSFRA